MKHRSSVGNKSVLDGKLLFAVNIPSQQVIKQAISIAKKLAFFIRTAVRGKSKLFTAALAKTIKKLFSCNHHTQNLQCKLSVSFDMHLF